MAALFGAVGADSRWAAALGRTIATQGTIPDGVPFARASTHGWANVPVLGELILAGLYGLLGDRGLMLGQLAAAAVAFAVLAGAMRASGASEPAAALALLVAAVGSLSALAVARLQLFSLVLFGILLLIIYREIERPSRRIWLLPPLFALWSNLHGAVLVGLAVAGIYLLVERLPRDGIVAGGVAAASVGAILATPALLDTPSYYVGVARSEAARQGLGLWATLSPTAPLDLVLIVSALTLGALALRGGPRRWELLAIVVLALLTLRTSRSGVWLVMVSAVPAARGIHVRERVRLRAAGTVTVVLVLCALYGIIRGPLVTGAGRTIVEEAIARADGGPILAQDTLAEQVALAGGTIWVGNPLDAFARADQRLYLAWTEGRPGGDAALRGRARVVLVHPGSSAERRVASSRAFRRVARDPQAVLYIRRRGASYPAARSA